MSITITLPWPNHNVTASALCVSCRDDHDLDGEYAHADASGCGALVCVECGTASCDEDSVRRDCFPGDPYCRDCRVEVGCGSPYCHDCY